MNKRLKTYVSIVITTLVVILCLNIWPWKNIKSPATNAHGTVSATEESAMLGSETTVTQLFVTFGEHLQEITLDCNVYHINPSESIKATIMDENGNTFFEKEISVKKIKNGKLTIKPQKDCEWGRVYRLRLRLVGEESVIAVRTADINEMALKEYLELAVFSIEQDYSYSFVADFTYLAESTPVRMLFNMGLVIGGGVLVYFLCYLMVGFVGKWQESVKKKLGIIMRLALSVIIIVVSSYAFYHCVVRRAFGNTIHDSIVFGAGIVVLCAFCMWILWTYRPFSIDDSGFKTFSTWMDYLSMISFALMIHSGVMYQNAVKQQEQYLNLQWVGIFLGAAVLFQAIEKAFKENKSHTKKWTWIHAGILIIFTIVLFVISWQYCKEKGSTEDLLELARLQCAKVGIWGYLCICVVCDWNKKLIKQLSIPFIAVWAFFAIWLWTHQYQYFYLKEIPIFFTILMLLNWEKEDYIRLIKNLANGIILAFFINLIYSLLHRPFHKWVFYRYPMYFFTVACTSEFLILIYSVVFGKWMLKYHKSGLNKSIPELFLLGVVTAYSIMTMARTATVAIVAIVLVGMVAYQIAFEKSIEKGMVQLLVVILSGILVFPTVYSATRAIPALVDDPYRFDIYLEKDFRDGIEKGADINDDNYMDFTRFLYCLTIRYQFPDFIVEWIEREYNKEYFGGIFDQSVLVADSAYVEGLIQNLHGMPVYITADNTNRLEEDVSNGRFYTWKAYFQHMNMQGHDTLEIDTDDPLVEGHAHNSFIQFLYSLGIPGGIGFIVLYLLAWVRALIIVIKDKENRNMYFLVLLFITAYGAASLTEWLSSLVIPLATVFWISLVVLSRKNSEKLHEREEF